MLNCVNKTNCHSLSTFFFIPSLPLNIVISIFLFCHLFLFQLFSCLPSFFFSLFYSFIAFLFHSPFLVHPFSLSLSPPLVFLLTFSFSLALSFTSIVFPLHSLSLSCSSSLFLSCHLSLVITSYHSPSFSWALSLPFLSCSLFKKCWPYRKNELNSSMYLYLVLPRIAVPEQFYNFNWKHIKHWANKNKYIYVNESDPIKSYFNLEPKQQLTFTYLTSLFTAQQRLLGEAKLKYRQYYNTVMQYHNDYRAYF